MNKTESTPSFNREVSDWRYERKFRLENISRQLALHIIRAHPAGFHTVYPDRWVNNIYFDDSELTALYENFDGIADRHKVRLRWYGESYPQGKYITRLEWKIRSNQLGNKRVLELPPVALSSLADLRNLVHAVWPEGDACRPTLFNRYGRSYFTTLNHRIRLTLDWDIQFSDPHVFFQTRRTQVILPGGVLELKYPPEEEEYAAWIIQQFPFRLSKNSKYVLGLLVLNGRGIVVL